jgi:hypothetical protein
LWGSWSPSSAHPVPSPIPRIGRSGEAVEILAPHVEPVVGDDQFGIDDALLADVDDPQLAEGLDPEGECHEDVAADPGGVERHDEAEQGEPGHGACRRRGRHLAELEAAVTPSHEEPGGHREHEQPQTGTRVGQAPDHGQPADDERVEPPPARPQAPGGGEHGEHQPQRTPGGRVPGFDVPVGDGHEPLGQVGSLFTRSTRARSLRANTHG